MRAMVAFTSWTVVQIRSSGHTDSTTSTSFSRRCCKQKKNGFERGVLARSTNSHAYLKIFKHICVRMKGTHLIDHGGCGVSHEHHLDRLCLPIQKTGEMQAESKLDVQKISAHKQVRCNHVIAERLRQPARFPRSLVLIKERFVYPHYDISHHGVCALTYRGLEFMLGLGGAAGADITQQPTQT